MSRDATTSQPTTKQCKNCGRAAAKHSTRCYACRTYFYAVGVERPEKLYRRKTKAERNGKPAQCVNCWRTAKHGERCQACYTYFYRHGVERPMELHRRKTLTDRGGQPAWCEVCGNPNVFMSGKCSACYEYWKTHKKKRPKYMWDEDAKCKNCGYPLKAVGVENSGQRRCRKGLCNPCRHYRQKMGKDRPKHLWGDGPHGFCECGYPAVALVEDIPVCVRHQE